MTDLKPNHPKMCFPQVPKQVSASSFVKKSTNTISSKNKNNRKPFLSTKRPRDKFKTLMLWQTGEGNYKIRLSEIRKRLKRRRNRTVRKN